MRSQWLLDLKGYVIRTTTEAAETFWPSPRELGPPYFNFRLEHIRQVERDALRLMEHEHGDEDIILAAVWIHDRFQPQFDGAQHADRAGRWARNHLKEIGFPQSKIERVARAVELHNHRTMDIPQDLHEARILWDADRLARLGPMGLLSYLMCHLAEDFLGDLGSNQDFKSGSLSIKEFAPILLERRESLYRADWFYFDSARTLARRRISANREWLDLLEMEIY